jgi:predicted Fe-Mo cluster-binding NifX family protein
MKICISSNGPNLDSFVDPRFGRCLYFIFVDPKNQKKINTVPNAGINAMRGAGIQAAQIVVEQGARVLITGNIGPNAFGVLNASRVKIFKAMPGTKIKDAISAFGEGQLPEMTQPFGGRFGPPGGPLGRGLGRRGRGPTEPGPGRGRGFGGGQRRNP